MLHLARLLSAPVQYTVPVHAGVERPQQAAACPKGCSCTGGPAALHAQLAAGNRSVVVVKAAAQGGPLACAQLNLQPPFCYRGAVHEAQRHNICTAAKGVSAPTILPQVCIYASNMFLTLCERQARQDRHAREHNVADLARASVDGHRSNTCAK